MKLSQLVKMSGKLRKINSGFVRIVAYKEGRDKKGFAVALAKSYTPTVFKGGKRQAAKDKSKYVTKITFIDNKLNVKVSCSCADFVFGGWEYANAKRGAADIIFGNGEPPTVKNPDNRPGLCKHLLAVAEEVKSRHPKLTGI